MPVNWVRVAWTVGIAALGFIVFFFYIEYDEEYKRRLSELGPIATKVSPGTPSKRPSPASTPKRKLPKKSRKYRLRR